MAGQEFEQALTAERVAESAAQLEPGWPVCPSCGRRMKAKGQRRRRLVTKVGEWWELAHGVDPAFTAVPGSKEDFPSAQWALAAERDLARAADMVVTVDRADWIWELSADYFPACGQIMDRYHACEHPA